MRAHAYFTAGANKTLLSSYFIYLSAICVDFLLFLIFLYSSVESRVAVVCGNKVAFSTHLGRRFDKREQPEATGRHASQPNQITVSFSPLLL